MLNSRASIFIAFAMVSCAAVSTASSDHEWLRPAPPALVGTLAKIPDSDFLPVSEAQRDHAIELLAEVSAVAVSETEARELAEPDTKITEGYVLVRGLCIGCGTGQFDVYGDRGVIVVDSIGLASRKARPLAWPVLVKLAAVPESVYVQCSAVE